jgi:hypothetical protein
MSKRRRFEILIFLFNNFGMSTENTQELTEDTVVSGEENQNPTDTSQTKKAKFDRRDNKSERKEKPSDGFQEELLAVDRVTRVTA